MGSSYYLILRGAWIIHIFYSFFSVVRKGTKEKRCFFFFVSTKKQLAKMMNFLNVYCNRIYTKQKLFSFCSPTPPHKLLKKQNLISEKCVQYFTQQRSFYTLLFFLFIQPHLLLLFFFFRFFVCLLLCFYPLFPYVFLVF